MLCLKPIKAPALVMLMLLLSGCSGLFMGLGCADWLAERKPRPIPGVHEIALHMDGQTYSLRLQCEEYYDSDCSVRGNYWAVRYQSDETQSYAKSYDLPLVHHTRAEAPWVISLPRCELLHERKELTLDMLRLEVDRMDYRFIRQEGGKALFESFPYPGVPVRHYLLDISVDYHYRATE